MKYLPVMGLEIHAELLSKTKIFCSCANEFGGRKNSNICSVCAGLPGAMPVINKEAVALAVRAGLATGCRINKRSFFDRKNYFYPDLPKAYQITQFEYPICEEGALEVSGKRIRINRIHIEEDAGKLIHDEESGRTLIDLNRCGVPLIEIVTEPDFTSIGEVTEFVNEIALRLKYAGVCDARLEQGSLRVDVNISLMPEGQSVPGVHTEIKNLNSLKSIRRALEFEIKRQTDLLECGEKVLRQTRRFDEKSGRTVSMRGKERAGDYRYFPEPDLPGVELTDADIGRIKAGMPEMPEMRRERYVKDMGLSQDDARLIASDREFSDFFDEAVGISGNSKIIARLMIGELNRSLNESGETVGQLRFAPGDMAELAVLLEGERVSKNAAKEIFAVMYKTGRHPSDIAEEEGLFLKDNSEQIRNIIKEVLAQNTENVKSYREGNQKLFGYFMGEVMHRAGKATAPSLVRSEILKSLEEFD